MKYILTPLLLLLLLLLGSLANAAELLRPAAPLITAAGILDTRQLGQCPAMQTACADGTGCCPNGAACTYVTGQPRCAVGCNGGPQCANGGCCQVGYVCDATGQLCHAAQTRFPTPLASSNPGGPIIVSSSNPGGPMMPVSSSNPGGPMTSAPMTSASSNPGGPMSSATPTTTSSEGGKPISSSAGSGPPTTPPGTGSAASLSVEWESWMMWVFTWAVGLPFIL